ncbi:3'(2'),5'-bisphosphate nucleotidase [Lysobacter sp. TY2-98]|uniref:3'(2'),5'-bisphosphate nucleotidase CysQ n=1 Tax=Lysobacter sp. TY2-98 TaxID=2290922 RepID=UPI000E208CEF|nr:3'(2'),5'-bisphosphate nucleotidase CysQ [Lysobacter sp. TY2-98]AXK71092.1 3'(2'),5'-bisphosphate nucleotidase [Lysobacter sp. TY2-98]
MPDAPLREAVIALAVDAARQILAVYEADFDVESKKDHSPLTEADLASHRVIAEGLARLTPDIPVLSEEAEHKVDADIRRAWRRLWIVDPLDGTREFVKRNGEFTVNIALVEDGIATWGVIQAPVTGVIWHGGATHGAFRRERLDGGDHAMHVQSPPGMPMRVAASRSHRDGRSEAFIDAMRTRGDVEQLNLGSSLKFCRIAEGGLDLYPRFGPTCEWDTAAGQAILEGAGGQVVDPRGRPLRYNVRDTLLNGDFIAIGDPQLPWREWTAAAQQASSP